MDDIVMTKDVIVSELREGLKRLDRAIDMVENEKDMNLFEGRIFFFTNLAQRMSLKSQELYQHYHHIFCDSFVHYQPQKCEGRKGY